MNINCLVNRCKSIALENLNFKSFYIGNTFDHSTSKGDTYPCLWAEMPILVDYNNACKHSKQFTFSLTFLTLPHLDDTVDEINMISHLEEYADKFLQYLKEDKDLSIVPSPTGLTVKAINADVACGIRIDIKVNTGRVCDDICDIKELCCEV
jgi:hypothetical protein